MKNKYKLYRYVHDFVFFQSLKYIHYAVTTKCNTKWKPSIFSTWTMNTVMFYTGNGCLDWSGSSGYHFSFHFFQAYFWISMFLCTNDIVTIVLSKTKKGKSIFIFLKARMVSKHFTMDYPRGCFRNFPSPTVQAL